MGQEALSETLRGKHAELEHLIEEEENRPRPDPSIVHSLKKQKLKIKDEIQREPH
jgi:hypothetical protein